MWIDARRNIVGISRRLGNLSSAFCEYLWQSGQVICLGFLRPRVQILGYNILFTGGQHLS
jgi:hypothetical protein